METQPAEHFLELIRQSRRGRFKLYLGMSAGVGKTYRMLEEAAELQRRGVDVVVGFVETHGRAQTEAKLAGLPVLPRSQVFYKGARVEEFDLPALLLRRPEVVVIDELAHTNAPGCTHEKRYQDVEAVLEAGISVISALNIQHIESLNSVVEKITGVAVTERVPDRVVQLADEVVNIDLTAEELLQRLREGHIYRPDKIDGALKNFFTPENILQLREVALREVAVRLERKLDQTLSRASRVRLVRICVAISTNEKSARHLIRKTARIAMEQASQWYVVFVETPKLAPDKIKLAEQRHLLKNFELALSLGGQVVQLKGTDVAQTIVGFALAEKANVLVIGKARPVWWRQLLRRDLLSRFIELIEDKDLDLLIVN